MKDGYTNQNSRQSCREDAFSIKNGVLVKYAGQETGVTVPDGVTKIAAHAFDSCTAVREVILPDSVQQIERFAFVHCLSLQHMQFGFGIRTIPAGCCQNLPALASITITGSLKQIETNAFRNCRLLSSVHVRAKRYRVPVTPEEKGYAYERQLMGYAPLFTWVESDSQALTDLSIDTGAFAGCERVDRAFWISRARSVAAGAFDCESPDESRNRQAGKQAAVPKPENERRKEMSVEALLLAKTGAMPEEAPLQAAIVEPEAEGEQPVAEPAAAVDTAGQAPVAESRKETPLFEGFFAQDGFIYREGSTEGKADVPVEQIKLSQSVAWALHRMREDHLYDHGPLLLSQALGLSEDKSRFLSRGNPNLEKIRKEFSEKLAAYLQSDEKATPCRNEEEREETWLFPEYEVEEGKIYNRLEGSVRPDAEIEVLGLGARGFRILVRENIRTVSQLLLCTEERLAGFAQMGQKTMEEIVEAVTDYLAGGGPGKPENSQTDYVIENGRIRHTGSGRLIDDAGIHSLGLHVRALGALQRNGIGTVSQLLFVSKEELMGMPNMGKKSVEEVCEAVNRYLTRPKDSLHETPAEKPAETVCCEADTRLTPDFIVDNGRIFRRDIDYEIEDGPVDMLGLGVRAANCLSRNAIFRLSQLVGMTEEELRALKFVGVQSADEIKQKLKAYVAVAPAKQDEDSGEGPKLSVCTEQDVLASYEKDPFALFTIEDIQAKLPDGVDPASVPAVVQTLLESGKMNRDQDRYGVVYETADGHIRRLLAHIPSTDKAYRFWNVLLNRLEGKTLEEIGQTLAISRERVRQLEKRALEALEREGQILEEDRYRYVYTTYRVEKEFVADFLQAPALWHYLSIRYKGGSRELEDALEDRHLSVSMRRHIERWVYRHCIYVDGTFLPARRNDIENYIAKVSCRDGVALEEFFSLYQAFLQEHHIHDERLALTEQTKRSRSNRLADSMHCLWKQNQRLRYYDIEGGDYTELLETLQLEQYADVEISTRKFLMDYPDLMKRYDIRDEYELHNLLKKIHAETRNPTLRFSRMPILIFGTFDCTAAVKEMLIALAPVSVNDLADALSRTYGHRKETVLANWLPRVSEYYHQGMCVADCDDMPQDHVETLKRCLTGDFYFLWEVRRLYRENVPGADLSLLTPYNLKKMGFFTGTSYILQHYPTAEAYFESLLLTDDVVDVAPLSKRYTGLSTYSGCLASLKHSRTIIEFEPYQYINRRRLEKLGVDKQALDRYGEDVWNFLTDGSYFSIQSLRQNGFQAELDTLGFGDLFYASLLKEDGRFAWQRVGNTVIFSPAGQAFSAREFLAALIEREESIDVGEFVRKLHDQYGVVMDRSDVLEKIKDSTVYFDKIMDKLYAGYEIYFEEI